MSRLEGLVEPGYGSVAKVLAKQLDNTPGGTALCMYHHGRKVIDAWGGRKDRAGNPWEEDTLSISFSTTKGVTATLLHIMVDRGLLDYDDPVAKYWPEFAEGGKENITVRHLLTHTANMYDVRSLVDHAEDLKDWDEVTSRLAQKTPPRGPTKSSTYHGMTFGWLVGEVVRRVLDDGRTFSEILRDELADPLGLDGLYIGLPDEEHYRVAELFMPGNPTGEKREASSKKKSRSQKMAQRVETLIRTARKLGIEIDTRSLVDALVVRGFNPNDLTKPEFLRSSSPAVNGTFTARSLARMYAALAAGGEIDGVRLMSASTVNRAIEPHISTLDRVIPFPMNWRLGYHQPLVLGRRPPRSFGHFGFGGSGAWADPDRNMSIALTVNSGTGSPWGDMRIMRLGRAAIKAADRNR